MTKSTRCYTIIFVKRIVTKFVNKNVNKKVNFNESPLVVFKLFY
nr:MAG TPA: hypothetical protein [Caudoviricetes sp.]